MEISINDTMAYKCKVYLNGEFLNGCVYANEEGGEADVYETPNSRIKTIKGDIRIEVPADVKEVWELEKRC